MDTNLIHYDFSMYIDRRYCRDRHRSYCKVIQVTTLCDNVSGKIVQARNQRGKVIILNLSDTFEFLGDVLL